MIFDSVMVLNVNILGHKMTFAPIQRYDAQSGPAQLGVVLVFLFLKKVTLFLE